MKDAYELTNDYLGSKFETDSRNFGGGATDDGYRLIGKFFEDYLEIFKRRVEEDSTKRGNKGKRKHLYALPVEILTLLSMEAAMSALSQPFDEDAEDVDDKTFRLRKMGSRIEDECYGQQFRQLKAEEAERIAQVIKDSAGSHTRRMGMLKRIASEHEFTWEPWSDSDKQRAALWCSECLAEGPLFGLTEDGELYATDLAIEETQLARLSAILRNPRAFPQTGPVQAWDYHQIHLNGIRYPLIRTYQASIRKEVARRFRAGEYAKTLEALNHAQAVKWRINKPILELIKWCFESNLLIDNKKYKIPPRKNPKILRLTQEELDAMPEPQRVNYWKSIKKQRVQNKSNNGDRNLLRQLIESAEELGDSSFWTPMNLDTRGRVYCLPSLNFQGNDHMRALLMFDEGQVLTEEGLYWLKVHVANCWGNDGIDKKPFDERVQWVADNYVWLYDVACAPTRYIEWTKADSPFLFVAACKALLDALRGLPVHIPVSFDGSCSGLQHLCAMMRSTEGSLVNLTPSAVPQDVYQAVAVRANELLKVETQERYVDIAQLLLKLENGKGVTRSLIKRLVMTYAYSSNEYGMKNQLMDDHMRSAYDDFLLGKRDSCPYGVEYWKTAAYLAKITRKAISQIISDPTAAMDFIKSVAGLWPHEGKPTVWHTPLGFPAISRYPKISTKQINLFLGNKTVRFQPKTSIELHQLNKEKTKNAASPNFVHSMDACHLMMVLLRCKAEGINSVALVHDSFGCLPNDAPRFRDYIRQEFRRLYEENDVLEQFRNEALSQLEVNPMKVPQVPPKGALDLSLIEKSDYCFA